jgi:hypothetical protein
MRRIAILLMVLLAVLVTAWLLLRSTDESIIKQQLSDAALQASFDVNEHPIARLGAAQQLSALFVENARFTLVTEEEEREFVFSVEDIRSKIVALRTSLAQLAISFQNMAVSVKDDAATVTATGIAMGRDHGREDYFMERHPIEILLVRTDAGWKIFEARNLDEIAVE